MSTCFGFHISSLDTLPSPFLSKLYQSSCSCCSVLNVAAAGFFGKSQKARLMRKDVLKKSLELLMTEENIFRIHEPQCPPNSIPCFHQIRPARIQLGFRTRTSPSERRRRKSLASRLQPGLARLTLERVTRRKTDQSWKSQSQRCPKLQTPLKNMEANFIASSFLWKKTCDHRKKSMIMFLRQPMTINHHVQHVWVQRLQLERLQ